MSEIKNVRGVKMSNTKNVYCEIFQSSKYPGVKY